MAIIAIGFFVVAIILNISLAQQRHRSVAGWIVAAIFFGLFSTLILAVSKDAYTQICPACKSAIPGDATKCRYCQSNVTPISPLLPKDINEENQRIWQSIKQQREREKEHPPTP